MLPCWFILQLISGTDVTSKQNFAVNLRLICDQYRSVAHVCRSLEMNRQQFNKYLSGKIYPSKHNLSRVCHFFKLTEEQLNLQPRAFGQVVAESFQSEADPGISEIEKTLESLPSSLDALARYEGFYYSHFHALGFPGHLVRSLVHIYRHQDRFYTRNTEHLWNKEKNDSHRHRFKYKGIALYLGDRIFITEIEMLTKSAVCHTILFPSYRNVVDTLSGITTGVGSINSHMPKATRVEYQFLGKQVQLKETLHGCGIYDLDSESIDSDIRERINNEMTDQEFMLTARDF
jgi:DNA-binding phage protein